MRTIQTAFLGCIVAFAIATPAVGQVIDLGPGQTIGSGVIPSGTTVNVNGGTIGLGVDLSNGTLNINSGNVAVGATSIASGFTNTNNTVNLSGGNVGGFFQNFGNGTLNITGGTIESFGLFNTSTANISGGTITRFPDVFSGGTANISGGDLFSIRVFAGGTINLFGSEFAINGNTIDDLAIGETRTITQRDVNLSGRLEDGESIEFDLNSSDLGFFSANPDLAQFGSTITVTRVVPEPSSLLLIGAGGVALLSRRRRA